MSGVSLLVAVDDSDASLHAYGWARDYVVKRSVPGDKVILLHVMNVASPSWFDPLHDNLDRVWNAEMDELAKKLESKYRELAAQDHIEVDWVIEKGEPREAIIKVASQLNPSMIVMGKRGLSGVAAFVLGSVSEYCVRNSPVPVMVIH